MRYDRFFTKLFCQPLLLEGSTRVGYELALLSLMQGQAPIIPDARKVDGEMASRRSENLLEVKEDTAVLHIDGALDKHLGWMDRLCMDATDIVDVQNALDRIAANDEVEHVLIKINSPGGSIAGIPETADQIAALAEKKNVFAFIDGMGGSAAYWLASAADQVFATPSSSVGSIGVYLALVDRSRSLEAMGVKIETIKDGRLKAAGAPWKSLSEDERSHFQAQVTNTGAMFRAAVTAKRPQVELDTMQGQSFMGRAALDRGLIDAVLPNMAAALAQFR